MSKNAERRLTNQSNELPVDELEHVSGGNGTAERKGGNQHEFIKITMNHVTISNH
jgi:hypothetical protein